MFIFQLEFILFFVMITSYIILIGNLLSKKLNNIFRDGSVRKGIKNNILFSVLSTISYICFHSYENKNYIIFYMSSFLIICISYSIINNLFLFLNKSNKKKIELLKEKENVQFYFGILNPTFQFYFLSLIISLLITSFLELHILYSLILILLITQFFVLVFRHLFSKKIAYYEYLKSIISTGDFIRVRLNDLTDYSKIRSYSLFELFIVDKIYKIKEDETFYLLGKIKSKVAGVYKTKALIHYRRFSLINVSPEERVFLDSEENSIIEILLSLQDKNFLRAGILFNELTTENKNRNKELERVILNNQNISFDTLYDNPDYYIIEAKDFNRNNPMEKYFHKFIKFRLLQLFNNECPISKLQTEIEMDHFFIPKSQGGNFILKRKDGKFIINAIPLHKSINIEKSDRNYKEVFSEEEISNIMIKINHLNEEINDKFKGINFEN